MTNLVSSHLPELLLSDCRVRLSHHLLVRHVVDLGLQVVEDEDHVALESNH